MKDNSKIAASGRITFYSIVNGVKTKVATTSNTILPNAIALVAQYMSGNDAAKLVNIRLFNGSTLVITGVITDRVFNLDDLKVTYTAAFEAASFSGDINKARLGPADPGTLGEFAEAEFPIYTKNIDNPLLAVWEITFGTS